MFSGGPGGGHGGDGGHACQGGLASPPRVSTSAAPFAAASVAARPAPVPSHGFEHGFSSSESSAPPGPLASSSTAAAGSVADFWSSLMGTPQTAGANVQRIYQQQARDQYRQGIR